VRSLELDNSTAEPYKIKIQNFEGPLDLLFHLIEKSKFNIYDIPINDVTDQYMEYLYAMNELNLDIASEFIVMAATLLHIKSKMLLPDKKNVDEEETDPREELVTRLIQYKRFKEYSGVLRQKEIEWAKVFYKFPEPIEKKKIYDDIEITVNELVNMYSGIVLGNVNKINKKTQIKNPVIQHERVSLKLKMKEIIQNLADKMFIAFSDMFSKKKSTKKEIVTGFIAVLELARQKKITVKQKKQFSDILIYNKKMS
jgi:segregation and condensation protein A